MENNLCFICEKKTSRLFEISKKKTRHTGKDVSEVLAHINGSFVSPLISICSKCLKNLNDYDEFSSRATEIQQEVKNLLGNKILIKQESDEDVEIYSPLMIDNLPVLKSEEIPERKKVAQVKITKKVAAQSTRKLYECEYPGCDRSYKEKFDLKDHFMRVHSDQRPFTCEICEKTFKTNGIYRTHMRCVHPKRLLPCKQCGLTLKNNSALQSHIRQVHLGIKKKPPKLENVKILECELCDRRFTCSYRLKIHTQMHGTERPYICALCGKTFKTKLCIAGHMQKLHLDKMEATCDACGKLFCRKYAIIGHFRTEHLKLKPCICHLCGKAFNNNHKLKMHQFVHNPDNRKYECSICKNRFHTTSKLKNHIKTHGEKQHECTICLKKYSNAYNLRVHLKAVHGVESFTGKTSKNSCQLCGLNFERKKMLTTHMRNVHEALPMSDNNLE